VVGIIVTGNLVGVFVESSVGVDVVGASVSMHTSMRLHMDPHPSEAVKSNS